MPSMSRRERTAAGTNVTPIAPSPVSTFAPAPRFPHLALPGDGSSPDEVLAARLRAARPVQGREPTQGWTVSD